MNRDNRPNEAQGVLRVRDVVEVLWKSGFQATSASMDDGIDGYIHLRRRGSDSGAILFAQIKCGNGYRADTQKRPDVVGINLKELDLHRERWEKLPIPAVIIYVDPSDLDGKGKPKAWWADLKSQESFAIGRKNYVLLPKLQRFGEHSKGDFYKLCGYKVPDQTLSAITLSKADSMYWALSGELKQHAREFYKEWSKAPNHIKNHPRLGAIEVNRVGWRHLCRLARKPSHTFQSWQLLGAAKRMIAEVSDFTQVGKKEQQIKCNNVFEVRDYVALRSWVAFPHRHEAVVQVVIKRRRRFDTQSNQVDQRAWFYSVYERRRG